MDGAGGRAGELLVDDGLDERAEVGHALVAQAHRPGFGDQAVEDGVAAGERCGGSLDRDALRHAAAFFRRHVPTPNVAMRNPTNASEPTTT